MSGSEIILSSGRKIYANQNIVGIDDQGELFEGYDGTISWPSLDYQEAALRAQHDGDWQLTSDDMRELCDIMIARWQKYKGSIL